MLDVDGARYQRLGSEAHARLGRGTYGHAVPGWDTKCLRQVAMKFQPKEQDEGVRDMCLFEAIGARKHPSMLDWHKWLGLCLTIMKSRVQIYV